MRAFVHMLAFLGASLLVAAWGGIDAALAHGSSTRRGHHRSRAYEHNNVTFLVENLQMGPDVKLSDNQTNNGFVSYFFDLTIQDGSGSGAIACGETSHDYTIKAQDWNNCAYQGEWSLSIVGRTYGVPVLHIQVMPTGASGKKSAGPVAVLVGNHNFTNDDFSYGETGEIGRYYGPSTLAIPANLEYVAPGIRNRARPF